MSEFVECALSKLFPVSISGEWGGEPFDGGNSLVIRAADFTKDCKLRRVIGAARTIPQEKLGIRILKDGDILIEKSGGSPDQPVGRVAFFNKSNEKKTYTHSNFLQLLRVAEEFDKKFSYYLMVFLYGSGLIYRYQQQTTGIINLKLEHYLREKVYIPSSSVQRRIQEILSIIDETIEKTEALIEKYQQIKAGLMHDLFTRGIAADGKLRPLSEQAPELYQETQIGWIPKDWTLDRCANIFDIDSGITLGAHRRPKENARPYLRVANVYKEKIKLHEIAFLEASKAENLRYGLKTNDLLLVEGHASVQQIGRCAIVDDNAEGMLFQNHLFRLRVKKKTLPYFSMYLLNSNTARKYWKTNCSTSSGLNTINRTMLGKMMFGLPKENEQQVIETKLNSISQYIDKEQVTLEKLQSRKAGLMHDLLTGKVPVNVDKAEAVNA